MTHGWRVRRVRRGRAARRAPGRGRGPVEHLGQVLRRHDPIADAGCRVAAAPDQLQHLGGELDLADAAAAELDVVALDRDLGVVPLDDAVDHGETEPAAAPRLDQLKPDEEREVEAAVTSSRFATGFSP